jgi:photosystem II stability/assembly factor-like uncharacterized protein
MKKYLYLIFIYCLCHNLSFAQKWLANTSSLSLISAGYQISHIIPVDDSLVWVLLSDQSYTKPAKLLRTRDSGNSWQASSIPNTINNDAFKIVSFDSLSVIVHIYTITDTSVLYKTTDGGKSWTKKLQVPNIGNLGFFDKKNGILVGAEENLVALTSDGGETWKVDSTTAKSFAKESTSFNLNLSTKGDTVNFVTSSYASGTKKLNRFHRSTDKGKTWNGFNLPLNGSEFDASLSFKDGKNGLISTFSNSKTTGAALVNLLTTADGGETWSNVPNIPAAFYAYQVPTITYVSNSPNSYILIGVTTVINSQYTTNGGKSWKTINAIPTKLGKSLLPGPVAFSSPKVGWFAINSSTDSTILYQWDGSSVLLSSSALVQKIDFSAYPNPSMGSINIEWRNIQTPPQNLRILDLMGKVVYEKKLLNLGDVNQNLDLQNLSNGLYFIEISTTNGIGLKKIMIQH